MGLLSTAFMVSYMVAAPIFGWLAGWTSRWMLIAVGVVLVELWPAVRVDLAGGFHDPLIDALLRRCRRRGLRARGTDRACLTFIPVEKRGRVLSLFYIAIPVGSALGYVLGGTIARLDPANQSWRWAFYVVVVPGLLLGLWSLLMREPQRGATDRVSEPSRRPKP